ADPAGNRRWARIVLTFLLSAFAVVVVVNGIFITLAVRSSHGVTSPTAYEEGLAHNQTLHQKAQQAALGWQVVRQVSTFPANLTYTIANAQGHPLTGATVIAQILRPLSANVPVSLPLPETAAGTYTAPTTWPAAGQWQVNLTITHHGHTLHTEERMIIH
ncbi:MAG: FixH family protein, partial [Alphaproteobacteria bacterium]